MNSRMQIYVLRHGETSWNKQRRLQGRHGPDLNEAGVLLAQITAKALKDVPFARCYTSPLLRASHTAQILMEGRDAPIIEEPRLSEICFGVWEGKCCDPKKPEIPMEGYFAFHRDAFGFQPPEGGESIREVIARTGDLYRELLEDPALQDQTVLLSTHGCASRAFLNPFFEDPDDFWQGGVPLNCAVSIVQVTDGVGRLIEKDKVFYGEEYRHNYYLH